MARLLGLIVILIVLAVGLSFALLNAEPVKINYYINSSELPLSLVVVITLLIGASLAAIAGMFTMLKLKRQISKLRKEARVTEKEVNNLRTIPIKDGP